MDMPDLALREAALKTLMDAVSAELKEVKAQMQQQMETTGASRVDAKLPDDTKVATISRADPKPTAVITDENAFKEWAHETYPTETKRRAVMVTEVQAAFTSRLLKDMTAAGVPCDPATGEVVPGVEVRATRSSSHSVRLTDSASEAIAAAWRDGQLGHLDLPQLGAGGGQ